VFAAQKKKPAKTRIASIKLKKENSFFFQQKSRVEISLKLKETGPSHLFVELSCSNDFRVQTAADLIDKQTS
jgi:hypothetical protein